MKKIVSLFAMALVAVTVPGCKSTHTGSATAFLTDGTWRLESVRGKAVADAGFTEKIPNAVFGADHKVSGNGGCNQYGGSYNLNEEGGINISEVFSTKMYCEGAKGEADYLDALSKVNVAKVTQNRLVLLHDHEELLLFRKEK